MLPQPNFGPSSGPEDNDDEVEGPPKQFRRLRIALWVQAALAVLAGNFLTVTVFTYRSMSAADLTEAFTETEGAEAAASLARDAHEYYQTTGFLAANLTIAGITILAAIVAALCAMRFKNRMKVVRRSAIAASIVLFLAGMLMTTVFGYLVAPWVFASVLSLWWLFSADIRHWMDRSSK
ncbi:hypothetical protein L0U85_03120 [Glycomyces sp. L485]|uniref:hypothetical protein n=1 Tax=Glycomyces sp. L485 TaxID=2909235 RepID=UPI001F4A9FEC|nr:hypothetical protein [Glycomyces sp. L485]MCH7229854.1 hypothetical protein [Glycomyces sp. L485]